MSSHVFLILIFLVAGNVIWALVYRALRRDVHKLVKRCASAEDSRDYLEAKAYNLKNPITPGI